MDFRQLRYFVAVAEELSFSAAARRLHISQPPLSLQIRAIEEELGAQLFKRDSRKVELTNAGELLLDGARKALAQLDRASEIVRQAVRGEAGELRVAFTASVPMFDAFPTILRKFRESHPAVIADLVHMSTAGQLQALADKTIDVGFLRPSPFFYPPGGISVKELWNDRLVAVLPVSHPLAVMNTPVPMEALAREDFILFPRGLGCGLFEHVSTLASRAGFGPRIRQEAREGTTILGLIAAGMGVSILPEIYTRTGIPGVAYRTIDAEGTESRLLIASRSDDDSPLLKHFLAFAGEFSTISDG